MDFYSLIGPLLRALPPETAHDLTLRALKAGLGPRADVPKSPVRLWGLDFPNPLGLAAGFDKNAEVMGPMLDLGFGFVEVGTITPRPQSGNPKPRMFRLAADRAVINRLGFNNAGMDAAARNLDAFRRDRPDAIVGVNVGKNRDSADAAADYAAVAARLAPYASYLVVNVSSPNTPGLRALQGRDELLAIVGKVRNAVAGVVPPLLVKIAPDLEPADRDAIAEAVAAVDIDGLIIGNTTVARPPSLTGPHRDEAGGLSGAPLFDLSTRVLRDMANRLDGRVPLIGTGGISSAADARAKRAAGASLVQLYTALAYEGPALVRKIAAVLA